MNDLCGCVAAIVLTACSISPGGDDGFLSGGDGATDGGTDAGADGAGTNADGGASDGDTGAGDEPGGDGGLDDGSGDGESSDAGDGGTPPSCEGSEQPAAGLHSAAPFGDPAQGPFTRSWGTVLATDAGKSVPMAADLDADGSVDIAVNGRAMSSTGIYPGNGDGTFGAIVHISGSGAGGWGMDIADLDGDGALDLAEGDHLGGAGAWVHTAGLGFDPRPTGLPAGAFSGAGIADLDCDGLLDLVLGADQFSYGFAVAIAGPGVTWSAPGLVGLPQYPGPADPTNAGHFAFADIEPDGDLDVFAFANSISTGRVTAFVYSNDGDGTSWTHAATLGGPFLGVIGTPVQGSLADLNEDGSPDVVVGGALFISQGAGWAAVATLDNAAAAHAGDVTGDGHLDVVTHSASTGLRLYSGDGTAQPGSWTLVDVGLPTGTFEPPEYAGSEGLNPNAGGYGIELADVDGNGRLDIIRSYKITYLPHPLLSSPATVLEVWTR